MKHSLAMAMFLTLGCTSSSAFDLGGVSGWAAGVKDATVGGAGEAWSATASTASGAAGMFVEMAEPVVGAAAVVPSWTTDRFEQVRSIGWPRDGVGLPFDATGALSMVDWLSFERMQDWMGSWKVEDRIQEARLAAASGMAMLPQDPIWWRDFGVTAVTVSAGVGGASAGCATIAAPAGPVAMAVSVGACGTGAAYGSTLAVQKGYELAGATIDADAMEWGTRVGLAVGTLGGNRLVHMSLGELQFLEMREAGNFGSIAGMMADKAMDALKDRILPVGDDEMR